MAPDSSNGGLKGHVFVVRGDITHLACDAWLLPTDRTLSLTESWLDAVPRIRRLAERGVLSEFHEGCVSRAIEDWPEGEPLPVLTAVPFEGVRGDDDIVELSRAARAFIRAAAQEVRRRHFDGSVWSRRGIPLVAMPMFGTAGGGGAELRGRILDALLDAAFDGASEDNVDVALVLRDGKTFALAQQRRRAHSEAWASLPERLRSHIPPLAQLASEGRLVPFMGAGVSISAGGLSWRALLIRLARDIGMSEGEIESVTNPKRAMLDQATIVRSRFLERPQTGAVDGGFAEAVAAAVALDRYGLTPALLATLQPQQAITLNYDTLFEDASNDVGVARNVIPYRGVEGAQAWVLKLHGTVEHPESIVLTRDDYLGFVASRNALSAIVKANLITNHLLFVGFGLADDHFHEILHDVRRALPGESSANATALTMIADPLDAALWSGSLNLVSIDGELSGEVRPDYAQLGRLLEIFLDRLVAEATDSHSYLLAPGFEHVLSPEQRKLREALEALEQQTDAQIKNLPEWDVVALMLRELGHPHVD